jgi:putative endonuclease
MGHHRTFGQMGEEIAVRHLRAGGLRIVARNWRSRTPGVRGELDVVAWDGPVLVFCEVKTRRGNEAGGPLAAVHARKLAQLRRLGAAYLAETGTVVIEVRIDVVGVTLRPQDGAPDVVHVRGAC